MNKLFFDVVNNITEAFSHLSDTINNSVYNSFGKIAILLLFISIVISLYIFIISLSYDLIEKKDEKKKFKYIMLFIRNYILNSDLIKYTKQCSIYIILSTIANSIIKAKLVELYEMFTFLFYNCIPIAVCVILILFMINCIIFWKSYNAKISYLKMILNINYFFLFLSVPFGIQFVIMSLISILLNIEVLQVLKFKLENKDKKNNSNDLYETRKGQLIDFHNTVERHKDENYAIALNGEWGTGKTKFLKAYMDKYRNDNHYIYIKPMITDNIEGLIRQFSEQLTKIMKKNGLWLGNSSSVEKYFIEILKLVQFNTKVSLDSFFSLGEMNDETYIDLKEKIQKDINELRGSDNKKIVIIVDDFDRIDEDKQKNTLHFIKEIVDFNGCITIFAFDYDNLEHNKIIKHEYLEKFVSEEKTLTKVNYSELLRYHISILDNFYTKNQLIRKYVEKIKYIILKESERFSILTEEAIRSEIVVPRDIKDDVKKKEYRESVIAKNDNWLNKMKYLDNSRRVVNFFNCIIETLKVIERKKEKYNEENEKMKEINIPGLIYFMNYIKIFDNDVYNEVINKNGIDEYCSILRGKLRFYNEKNNREKALESEVQLIYFNNILSNIINTYPIGEEASVVERAQFNVIKDLFVDYNLEINDINLNTKTKIMLDRIDQGLVTKTVELFDESVLKNKEKLIKGLEEYLQVIFSNNFNEIISESRIEKLSNYMIKMFKDKNLSLYDVIKLVPIKIRYYESVKFIKYFIEPLIDELDKNQYGVTEEEKKSIDAILENMNVDNIHQYTIVFIQYISIVKLDESDFNYEDINEKIGGSYNNEILLKNIKKYINNDYIKNFDELHNYFLDNIKKNNKSIIAFDMLEEKYNEFYNNCDLIEKLRERIISKDTKNKYSDLFYYWDINDLNGIKKLLRELNENEELDYDMTECFVRAVNLISENYYDRVDDLIQKYCMSIIKKIDKRFSNKKYAYINLTIKVQRILNSQ